MKAAINVSRRAERMVFHMEAALGTMEVYLARKWKVSESVTGLKENLT